MRDTTVASPNCMRMQITAMSVGDYLSDVETILTAIVFIGSIVAVLHAIAVFIIVDTLPVSAYELVRRASCTQKEIIDYYTFCESCYCCLFNLSDVSNINP